MSKVKDRKGNLKRNTKQGVKLQAKESNGVLQELYSNGYNVESKQSCVINHVNQAGKENGDVFQSCHDKVRCKLESELTGLKGQSFKSCVDGDKLRKTILTEKCITKDSLQDIKLLFTEILTIKDEASCATLCTLALKYLRIFIDILEAAKDNQLVLAIQACDFVITVLQYIFTLNAMASIDQFVSMLFHVIKQLYKKEYIGGIVAITKNITNFMEYAAKKKVAFSDGAKQSLNMINEMCYSLYAKRLQKLVSNNQLDITSFFELRVASLMLLSFMSWCEKKFMDHAQMFFARWTVMLTQSCICDTSAVSVSISELIHTIYRSITIKCSDTSPLLDILWKSFILYIVFSLSNNIYSNFHKLADFLPCDNYFSKDMILLDKSIEIGKLISKSKSRPLCICSNNNSKNFVSQYPTFMKNHFKVLDKGNRLFDIISLLRAISKDSKKLCGVLLNALLELISYALSAILTLSETAQKNVTSPLLRYAHILFMQINSHLFTKEIDSIECYSESTILSNDFDSVYKDFIITLQALMKKQYAITEEDSIWMRVIFHKIGVHHYKAGKFSLALFSLEFSTSLLELWAGDDYGSILKDVVARYSTLMECHSHLGDFYSCYQTCVTLIKRFGRLSDEKLLENQKMLETQIICWVKRKRQLISTEKNSSLQERCLYDEISDERKMFLALVLEYEFHAYKKLSPSSKMDPLLKRVIELRKDIYEEDGDMLKYAVCMIEISTLSSLERKERYHWCSEAVTLLEGMSEDCCESEDEFGWRIRDVLALSYYQRSVILYEEKVVQSMGCVDRNINEIVADCSDMDKDDGGEAFDKYMLEEDFTDKQFIASMDMAVELWTGITEEAWRDDPEKGNITLFHDPEESAKCLYQSAILYSLLCQNLDSVKTSYLSGLLYQMLSLNTGRKEHKEKGVVSWMLTASQFLLLENIPFGKEILDRLQYVDNCSKFSILHIAILKAVYSLFSGESKSSANHFHELLNSELLNNNTEAALTVKSDIYFLLSYIKLISLKENEGEFVLPQGDHYPIKSPFPPMHDCIIYLECLVKNKVAQDGDMVLSSSWAYLDKLLLCLSRKAELLKHQGSVLEARACLKQALLLSRKYHLLLRTLDILQQLASLHLILNDETAFNDTFDTVTKILKQSVGDCFNETELTVPAFVSHPSYCGCSYCVYPKMHEIHICFYTQYVKGKQQFNPTEVPSVGLVDTLVENAYSCYNASFTAATNVMNMNLKCFEHAAERTKRGVKSKRKQKSAVRKEDCELFNIFSRYSFEAQISESIKNNRKVIQTVEQLISKVESSKSFELNQHESRRLLAQLYSLKTLLRITEDIANNAWFCKTSGYGDKENDAPDNVEYPVVDLSHNIVETPKIKRKIRGKGRCVKKVNKTTEVIVMKSSKKSNYPNELNLVKSLEELQFTLSLLNPYTDTLIIKAIYQLIVLLSGTSNKALTVACQLLSFSRTLHQQMLTSYGNKLREKKKAQISVKNKQQLRLAFELLEKYSDPPLVFDQQSVQDLLTDIPKDWCICNMSLSEVEKKKYLIVCRLESLKPPTVVKINLSDRPKCNTKRRNLVCDLASAFNEDLEEKFKSILVASVESMKIQDKKSWWEERVRLDKQMKSSISRLEDEWLIGWRGLLLGHFQDEELESDLIGISSDITNDILTATSISPDEVLIKCLVDGFKYSAKHQIIDSMKVMFGEENVETVYEIFLKHLEKNEDLSRIMSINPVTRRKPVILVLDKTLQMLPWESIPILKGQPVTRMPSLLMTSSHCRNYQEMINDGVTLHKGSYILNPKDDLKLTEDKFSQWFKSEGWHGICGRPPTQEEFADGISQSDLFIYCGHGSGQEYLSWSAINRLHSNAVSLLMGCSSGKLHIQGELEAQGMVHYYLSAGCPVVVANLWEVTSKDIDLFLEKLLNLWLTEERGKSIADCVDRARCACKLEYLNGAAPVVYGLPVSVKNS